MSYKVSVDIDLGAFQQEFVARLFPVVKQAIAMTAEHGANLWRKSVEDAKLYPAEKERYLDSIDWNFTGSLTAEITTTYILAGEIETGRPSYDMKKCLQTSQKTRLSKKTGHKYLIIPFRHNTPGNTAHAQAMPKSIYLSAKKLNLSSITGETTRLSASGHTVKQNIYKWANPNGRLPNGMLGPNQKGKHDRYSGMVKMKDNSSKNILVNALNQVTGKAAAYMTFRVMSEGSTGWIMPAKPGLFIAKDVIDKLQPILDKAISKASSI